MKRTERWHQVLFKHTRDIILFVHLDGRILDVNEAAIKAYGYSYEELLSKKIYDLRHPKLRGIVRQEMDRAAEQGLLFETLHLHRDGYSFPVEVNSRLSNIDGEPILVSIIRDITKRKRTEQALADQTRELQAINRLLTLFSSRSSRKEYFARLLELIQEWSGCRCIGIRLLDSLGNIPYEASIGFSQEFWTYENWLSIHHTSCTCTRIITGQNLPQDTMVLTEAGSFCCNHLPQFFEGLSLAERKQYRGKCLEYGFQSIAVIPINNRGQVLGVLHLADEKADIIQPGVITFIENVISLIGEAIYKFNLEENSRLNYEYQIELNANLEITMEELRQAEEELRTHRNHLEELMERRTAEIALANRKLQQLAAIIEYSDDAIIRCDRDGIITHWNPGAKRMFGYTEAEIVGQPIYLLAPEDRKEETMEVIGKIMRGEQVNHFETVRRRKDGTLLDVSTCLFVIKDNLGNPIGISSVSQDITERKQIQTEMARLDRLNLIAQLAAGISHEVRNPMTTVRGFLQMLGSKKDNARYKEYYDLMIEELDRANFIITEFLSLGKTKTAEVAPQSLSKITQALMPLIEADAVGSDKYVLAEITEVPELQLNEKEIRQVILNLARNGIEAMETGKKLTIRCYQQNQDILLQIEDQGPGIPPEVLEKLGTPFFTTKENGTGLGLAVCYSIAAQHQAKLEVTTSPGGTTFTMRFPTWKI